MTIEQKECFNILKTYKRRLNKQQINTFKGQILKGDVIGFKKGLNKVINK